MGVARHHRLKTQIHIIEEEDRNRDSLITQKEIGHFLQPNSEIKHKKSKIFD